MSSTQEYISGCLCWLTNKIDLNFEQDDQALSDEFISKCKCSRHPDISSKDCWTNYLSKKDQLDLRSKIFSGCFGKRAFYLNGQEKKTRENI